MNANQNLLYQLIGERIKSLREQMSPRMSQQKLADRIALTRASIVNIEAGRQKAPVHVIWCICEELGVEMSEVIPHSTVLVNADVPLHLTPEQVDVIEKTANDNLTTRRLLERFVSSANRSQGGLK